MVEGLLSAVVGAKASITVEGSGDGVKCLFNPSDFTIERSVNYAEHRIPGKDKPIVQYVNGEAETMQFSLFFDSYMASADAGDIALAATAVMPALLKKDVRKYTEPFYKLMDMDSDEHKPNTVAFEWGSVKFTGVVASVSQKFTMFSPKGVPLRALLNITLKSYVDNKLVKNSPDRTKNKALVEGERLYQLAHKEYGDCGMWRKIAEANAIDNPRRLRSGENVAIPAII